MTIRFKKYKIKVQIFYKEGSMEYTTVAIGKSGEAAKDDVIRNEYACFRKTHGHAPEKVIAFILNPDVKNIPTEYIEEGK